MLPVFLWLLYVCFLSTVKYFVLNFIYISVLIKLKPLLMGILKKITTAFSIVFLFFQINLSAQDKLPIKFGKVKLEDFDVKSPLIDSNTNAVVVADVGSSEFMANTNEMSLSLIFKEKKRIKILNKNGFDAATVIIPLYVSNNNPEKLQDIDAFTYNIEDGKVVSVKVDKSSIFTENKNEHWIYKKFTFPALKEGSIIEYSYTIKSDYYFNLHDWAFQSEHPTLWSQYDAGIPAFYHFITLSQGYQPYAVKKTDRAQVVYIFQERVAREGGTFTSTGGSSLETHKLEDAIDYNTWIMKDVPGLKEEPFTTTKENAIAKIEFQLQQVAYPNTIPRDVMSNWEKVSENMMLDEHFGSLITRPNNWLDDEVAGVLKGASSSAEKTRKIYEYIRDNFSCTDYNRYKVSTSLKDVMKNKSGSVADINMLLIAMLRTQGIAADPVCAGRRRTHRGSQRALCSHSRTHGPSNPKVLRKRARCHRHLRLLCHCARAGRRTRRRATSRTFCSAGRRQRRFQAEYENALLSTGDAVCPKQCVAPALVPCLRNACLRPSP